MLANFFISLFFLLNCIFWPQRVKKVKFLPFLNTFWPFWRTSLKKWKKWIKPKSCTTSIPIWSVASVFFIFSKERLQNDKKIPKNVTKVTCTFSCAVRECAHVHTHKHYKSTWETPRTISWKFGQVWTSFGRAMDTWKKCYFCHRQTRKQTDAAQFNYRIKDASRPKKI